LSCSSANEHDFSLFFESFEKLLEITDYLDVDLKGTYLTLDSAFDNRFSKSEILFHNMIPVIKPNLRGLKSEERRNERLAEFGEVEEIYKQRLHVEKFFAWEDTYRKLVIRYEKLQCTFLGFRYLAFSMINFRNVFN